ncbi:DUF1611 domain-containing protein [Pseudohaliea rubra]|uniref:Protein often near L-alanine-DL-glutamate epimerase (Cell wall recycling) n=1 Tax=Pseudohaliea rubra DSM 19751 TaxID=1265313 RepID=A0A095VSE7_9GAMM|nr:DUF1611 domain-containing protein [Pseudohaliea rubra]KGE04387.1 Protein often near L-alanine-DL-glutamate epimerase (cell wall recycling) [Pseudohaliea rubra DSM 19751]
MQRIELKAPYLVFVGDETRLTYAKTGRGIVDWRRELCAGQLRLTAGACDLGLPEMSVSEAAAAGIGSLVIGTALVGGSIPPAWVATLAEAARAGIDIVAGLHTRLASIPELVAAAGESGARLVDVRIPPANLPVGTGKKRSGKRLLTVGTDCALGKKYTALQLEKDLRAAGVAADFRASGQTGIMIAGEGIPIDCVVADFISGAAEILSPDNDPDHWDVIEGQGSIFHPGYAAVSHGLLIGSQPDAFVVCHAAGRTHIEGWPHMPLPSIGEVLERTVQIGALTNPALRCAGISVNTAAVPETERRDYLTRLGERYGLPAVDPLLTGTAAILDNL